MNYFAHGHRFIERPYFLAGTAVPDWLSVADRRVRMRGKLAEPFADGSRTPEAELAAGVLQHLEDDTRFHRTVTFMEVSNRLTELFRDSLPGDGYRPGFLGHIVTELLLDAVLIERHDGALDAYYDAVSSVDPHLVQRAVNRMAKRTTDRLAELIPRFHSEQFLFDYLDSEKLLYRLNQVMRRVKLHVLPPRTVDVLESARPVVREHADALLAPCHSFLAQ